MSIPTILTTLQGEINSVLKETYASSGPGKITCAVNDKIVKLVNGSGLLQAAQSISDDELEVVAKLFEKNIQNMNAFISSGAISCQKGGRKKRTKKGGSSDGFGIFLDGTTSGGSRGGMPGRRSTRGRSRRSAPEEEEEEEVEEEEISVTTEDTGRSSRSRRRAPESAPADLGVEDAGVNFETPQSPNYSATTPPPPTSRRAGPTPIPVARASDRVIANPMPTNVNIGQDMIADLDGYQMLALFYIALINGVLTGTGAYAAAIDTVAGAAGSAIGLPELISVCGIAEREVRTQGSRYLRTGVECLEAQQRWEQLLITMGVMVFVIVAVLSARGTRRIDATARVRGPTAMIYEMSMASVTTLADYMRGVPKGAPLPDPETQSTAARILANPLNGLASLASRTWESASSIFRTPPTAPTAIATPAPLALEDMPSPPPPSRQASASARASSGNTLGVPGAAVTSRDMEDIRALRLAALQGQTQTPRERSGSISDLSDDEGEITGGRKKRKTRRRKAKKAKKSKKGRKTRRKAPKKTRKAKNGKKRVNKKARKTKRRR